ncbi:hypothetical protein LR48_Vigan848s000200 [Vigna angularis]|uniref:Uncharacterized protein n=1 Tax=Phaseolus angularis TaxID=3914 RepID=A0A0L9THP3_PHAAN|nr:hypothetical protein LR48_Vigan848s000200 [Vigna angularis]
MGTQFYHWWEPHSSIDQSQFWQAAGQFENQPQQQWQQQSSLLERRRKLDEVLQQFMQQSISTQKSIEASCKRVKTNIRYIIQKLHDSRFYTEVNPREEGQAIVTKSDKNFDEEKIERDKEKIEEKETERLSEKDKDEEKEKEVVERQEKKRNVCENKEVEWKKRREEKNKRKEKEKIEGEEKKEKEFERFMEIFKKLEIKVPMIETLQQGWPPHRARDSRLQYLKGRRRNQINPIPASSFPVSMSNTSSLSKIAWQEKQAQARRTGATEAPVMEEDDEDNDFEDVEEGEEEDYDDSMS